LDLDQAVFIGLYIGAMVAREQNHERWLLYKAL